MGKKKSEKVTPIREMGEEQVKEVVIDPRENMTPEEIEAFMKQEEAELDKHLSRFLAANPIKPNPVDEEDEEDKEEEEVFTLDLEKGVVTQIETQGILIREGDACMEDVAPDKEALDDGGNLSVTGTVTIKHNPYPEMISRILVSRALAKLLSELNHAEMRAHTEMSKVPWDLSMVMENEDLPITKYKKELRKAWSPISGEVHMDLIPEWAKGYVQEYIGRAIGTLVDLM